MKKNTPSIIDVAQKYGSTEACVRYLEAARWPDGVRCLVCGCDKISKFVSNETTRERKDRKGNVREVRVPARHLYTCLEPTCGHQFSPTAGTIFHDTHLPLEKWFQAVALMCNAKKGISAKQMQRDIGVTYRTAWYLCHRIRKAMENGFEGMMTGTVEMDETYVGARVYDKRRKTIRPNGKAPVFGMVQRATETEPSKVYTTPLIAANKLFVTGVINERLSPSADLVLADNSTLYKGLGKRFAHETINHMKGEYVSRTNCNVHTQSIESYWSLFKRGVIGSFHKVSVKHLGRYLNEFSFRFNNREEEDLFGLVMLKLVIGTALQFRQITQSRDLRADAWSQASEPF